MLRRQPLMFATWRTIHKLVKRDPNIFSESDCSWILAAVTSHTNIGGGLDPFQPIPNRTPEEAYQLATCLLHRFKVVTANSKLLYNLLKPSLPNIVYCPNGVDVDRFAPTKNKNFDNKNIRVGWIGKNRPAKNLPIVMEVSKQLSERGVVLSPVVVEKKFRMTGMSLTDLKNYYSSIDFYLCASWNEGTPNPALEAGASGVPIISTKVGNMLDVIVNGVNGYFVNPSFESITKQLEDLREISVEDYRSLSDSIRGTIEANWSWEKNIRYFSEAFDLLTE